ncbi:MAG: aminoacyl-tRNA hydrolase [Pseudomonadales bacterium]|jgi:PTH1 family peptidyl-tRNA hydrolase|nr:aminoacyl-tRNA hydrolase [Pseudomonadales bacterium]
MKLIVGLGNPGENYKNTRHNTGALFLDYVRQQKTSSPWKESSRFKSLISETNLGDQKCLLVFPQTYMNLSGQATSSVMKYYKISSEDLVVVYDDLDLQLGKYKFADHGPKCHNGLNDVLCQIDSNFLQIRIGIDGRGDNRTMSGKDYVLTPFIADERTILNQTFEHIYAELVSHLK